MFIVAVAIGALFVFNGFVTSSGAETVMHQLYGAMYIVGGTLCILLGALLFTLGGIRKDIRASVAAHTPKSSP